MGRGRKRWGGRGDDGWRKRPRSREDEALKESGEELTFRMLDRAEIARVKEEDVGITGFLTQAEPFGGILKMRFEDFLVREIGLDGSVVRLDDTEVPADMVVEAAAPMVELDCESRLEKMEEALGNAEVEAEEVQEFRQFVEKAIGEENEGELLFEFKPFKGKEMRKAVHLIVKMFLPEFVSSTREGAVQVLLKKHQKSAGVPVDRRRETIFTKGSPQYVRFVLHKTNIDTIQAVSRLSSIIGLSSKVMRYAGTKDRRATTTQLITAFKVEPTRILQAAEKLKPMIQVGNFSRVDSQLGLGDLVGNHFEIVLREVRLIEDAGNFSNFETRQKIVRALEEVKEKGFINYFGMQRFGGSSLPNYLVGLCLIKRNVAQAIEMILSPREDDYITMQPVRQLIVEKKYREAAEILRGPFMAEKVLLNQLALNGENNLMNAFLRIPRNLRLMYLHSFQSKIFNEAATFRIQRYGSSQPVIGDLIILDHEKANSKEYSSVNDRPKEMVRVVGKGEEHLYSLEDVVLPIPGHTSVLPLNEVGEFITKSLESYGLSLQDFANPTREFDLRGGYRKLIAKPKDLTWKFFDYDDEKVPLIVSDLDRLEGKPEPESLPDGKFLALRLGFSLDSSSYATMFFRELTKQSSLRIFEADENSSDEAKEMEPEILEVE